MQYILDAVRTVLKEFGGADIFETAENAGVKVWFRSFASLKGFYIFENNCRYIVINEGLDDALKSVVCAHELGHDMLHRELSVGGIRENTLFLANNKTEREANLFAAEILIPDEDFLTALSCCDSADRLARQLCFPPELVAFKVELMNFKGCNLRLSGVSSDFLK